MGLAMCTTMVMAQTAKKVNEIKGPAKVIPTEALQTPVDYKASIFTKDDDVVITTYDFSEMTGITYQTQGIKSGDKINVNGKDSTFDATTCHGRSEANTYWTRIENIDYLTSTEFNTTYPQSLKYGAVNIPTYMGSANGIEEDNGFMFISLIEYFNNTGKGNVNAYFEMPAVTIPEGTKVLDIDWRQYHRKFYESCFVDYQKNDKWYAVEVNIPNIDVDVNANSTSHYYLTLPPAAADQDELVIRFRVSASDASQVYGYMWAIDNVRYVVPAASARWDFIQYGYMDGFYGTIPQKFNIPMGFVAYGRNRGSDDLSGVSLKVNHVQTGTDVLSVSQNDMPAGNPQATNLVTINERGFMQAGKGLDNTSGYYQTVSQFWENAEHYGDLAENMPSKYKLRGLPTETAGMNQFALLASNEQGLNSPLDSMAYYVSPFADADEDMGRTIEGYRWANDNSVVPSGSQFAYQFTDDGYITDDPEASHQFQPDYEVFTTLNSPSVVPTDDNGEPWVFRGLEYVTATNLTASEVDGAKIVPIMWYMAPIEGNDIGLYDVQGTGLAGDQVFTIDGNTSAPEEVEYGVTQPGSPYYAFNVLFPGQPEIMPNVTYFLGYQNMGGNFAVAGTQSYYMYDADSAVRYRDNEQVAAYARQLNPLYKVYTVLAYDPIYGKSVSGWNITRYPFIRAIVGPKMSIPQYEITFDCAAEDNYWMTTGSIANMCGYVDTVAENSSMSYYIMPGDIDEWDEESGVLGHYVIDEILVDGKSVNLNDEDMISASEYNVTDEDGNVLLERSYYRVTLRDIAENHSISAKASYKELSVREAEDLINIALAPNPATSQVRLNVSGMTGMVDCSIIDMSGRQVYASSFVAGSEQTIDLSGVAAGAYFVRITNNDFSKVEKLIVR